MNPPSQFYQGVYGLVQDGSHVYVMGMDGMGMGIRVSTNLGQSWQSLNAPHRYYYNLRLEAGELLVSFSNEGEDSLLNYRDGQWYAMGQMPGHLEFIALPGDPPVLFAPYGATRPAWMSSDRGMTWESHDYQLPFETQNYWVTHPTYDPYRHRIWVSAGIGVCYLEETDLKADGPLVFKPADYTLLSVYPNPFNAEAKIRFDLLRPGKVSLRLYDLQGRLVKTVLSGVKQAGRHEPSLSVPDLASGMYFLRLATPEHTRTAKVLIVK